MRQVLSLLLAGAVTGLFSISSVNANLITNGDFSAGNTGFTSQYLFVTHNFPEGQYGIDDDPKQFNPLGASFGDHTTGHGLMFLLNGAPTANVVAWQESVSVTPGTEYLLTGWVATWGLAFGVVGDPSPSQLKFLINGVQIGSTVVPDAPSGQWKKFSLPWNSGLSNSANIQMIDLNLTLVGNDSALDDLSFAPARVPEPTALGLMGLGLALFGLRSNRGARNAGNPNC